MNNNIISISNVSKSFPGVLANDNVSLDIQNNTVHALLGENGAGKSTLVKILYGILEHDEGEIFFNNVKFSVSSPAKARKNGIGMVFQHFSLFDSLTVAENLILGLDEKISLSKLKNKVESLSSKLSQTQSLKKSLMQDLLTGKVRVSVD